MRDLWIPNIDPDVVSPLFLYRNYSVRQFFGRRIDNTVVHANELLPENGK